MTVLSLVWGAIAVTGSVMRGRRVSAEAPVLGVFCAIFVMAAAILWHSHTPAATGLMIAAGTAVAWRVRGYGRLLAVYGGGLSLGLALYAGGMGVVAGFLPGLAAGAGLAAAVWWRKVSAAARGAARMAPYQHHAFLCYGRACRQRGAELLWDSLQSSPAWKMRAGVRVNTSQCLGRCQEGPVLRMEPQGWTVSRLKIRDLPQLLTLGGLHEE